MLLEVLMLKIYQQKRNEIATMIEQGIRGQVEGLDGKPVSIESVQLKK